MKRFWALVCLLVFAVNPAFAENRSIAYATWNVTGGAARVLYMLPAESAKNLAAPGAPLLTTKQVADYILAHLAVSRQGKACPVVDQGEDLGLINTLALTPGFLRFEILFQCPDGIGLTLSDRAFADRVANHVDFARLQINNSGLVNHVFTADAPRFELPRGGGALQSDSALRYAGLGLAHVSRSAEILCFMLALLLIARRRRDLAIGLAALVAGYGLACVLSIFNLAAPRFAAGQAVSGLLVLAVAVSAVVLSLRDPRRGAAVLGAGAIVLAIPALFLHGWDAALGVLGLGLAAGSAAFLPSREDSRAVFLLIAPFVFALLDGFTMAGDVSILALAPAQLAPMVLGFNVATFLAALVLPLLVVAVWFAVPMLRRLVSPGGLIPEVAASAFIAAGIFWFGTWVF